MRFAFAITALGLSACMHTPSQPWDTYLTEGETLGAPLAGARLSAAGLGPLRIGMRIEEVNALLHADLEAIATDEGCSEWSVVQALLGRDGRVVRISTYGDLGIRTPEGIGVGSTAGEVRATYPEAVRQSAEYYEEPAHELYIWRDMEEWLGLFFRINEQERVAEMQAGGELRNIEGCVPSP